MAAGEHERDNETTRGKKKRRLRESNTPLPSVIPRAPTFSSCALIKAHPPPSSWRPITKCMWRWVRKPNLTQLCCHGVGDNQHGKNVRVILPRGELFLFSILMGVIAIPHVHHSHHSHVQSTAQILHSAFPLFGNCYTKSENAQIRQGKSNSWIIDGCLRGTSRLSSL